MSAAHLSLERHVWCEAHAAWTHDDELHVAASHADATAALEHGLAVRAPAAIDQHGHEHCLFFVERRELALLQDNPIERPLPASIGDRLRSAGVAGGLQAIYTLAPKTSPPA